MKKLLSLSLLLFLFSTCKKDAVTQVAEEKVPVADFNFSKSEYSSGETIELTNNSVDAETFRWTLPDGTTSKSKSISFVPPSSNLSQTFTFRLDAISKSGTKSDYVVKRITVKPPTGQLLIVVGDFYDGTQVYLTIGSESKGLVTLKSYPGSLSSVNCGDERFLNYEVPVGLTVVVFTTLQGNTITKSITISSTYCNKLTF